MLASEQRLLDEANMGEESDGGASEKKDDKPRDRGVKLRALADGKYATESAYTSATTLRLKAVKAAAKPPLRTTFLPFLGVLWSLTFVSLLQRLFWEVTKLVLRFDELTSDITVSNILRAEVCLSFFCVLPRWVILTTFKF